MARITAGIGTSHVALMGRAIDAGMTDEPYWKPIFDGYKWTRDWIAKDENKPDVVILVYNDHMTAFDLKVVPTFSIGCGPEFNPADEGYGPRPVPVVKGAPDLAWHVTNSVVNQGFDLTIVNEMDVDHGLTVPLSAMFNQPEQWPCKVIPIAVNVILHPIPTGRRCYNLGKAIAKAVETFDQDIKVQVWGTGGMSHQLQGPRAGLINSKWDNEFLDRLVDDAEGLADIPHEEYVREIGSEGIEMVMWLVMRGALGEKVRQLHRHYHVPCSNSSVGHIVLENC